MADVITATYDFTLPEVGASDDTWGTKLNANWAKMETLFNGAFTSGSPSGLGGTLELIGSAPNIRLQETDQIAPAGQYRNYVNGDVYFLQRALTANFATTTNAYSFDGAILNFQVSMTISNNAPSLRFEETDQTDPAGRWRFLGATGNFHFQKALTVDMASWESIWSTDSNGQTEFTKPVVLTGGINGSPVIESTTPSLRFHEIDATEPKGRWQLQASGAGDTFTLYNSLATNWSSNQTFWQCTTGPNAVSFAVPVSFPGTITGSTIMAGTFELSSTAPQIRWNETDQAGALGRYRMMVSGDGFFVHKNTAAAGDFTSTSLMLSFDASEFVTYGLTRLSSTAAAAVEIGHSGGAAIKFMRSSSINYMRVINGATLRVVDDAGSTAWASINGVSGWAAGTSDARMKENVRDIHYGLNTVMQLRSVEFDWIAEQRHDIGLIAQEVEPIIPEIVEVWKADPNKEGSTDTYAMRKDALVAVLIKAMQELTVRVQTLEGAN